ncbi:MAG: hypothetical protein PWQ82_308 [Thermosediminibacterales bacterium]|nr:hypothetical protein [Thermosediminibacterales bacterium]MDK2836410.1 hypothetical protein [Thermosediminibacterales bacterium]
MTHLNNNRGMDITKNIKMIEWLKSELLSATAHLFKSLINGSEEMILDALSNIIIVCYLLAKRLGLSYSRIDLNMESKIMMNIKRGHEAEKWYGDLSDLYQFLRGNREI